MIKKNSMIANQKSNPHQQDFSAILFALMGYLGYSIVDALTKWLLIDLHLSQIAMIINSMSAVILFFIILFTQGVQGFKVNNPRMHIYRILFFLSVPYFILRALDILPLSEFYPIFFLTPIFVIIGSIIFLKEPFEKTKILMAFIGLIGVVIVAQGSFATHWDGFLYTFMAMLCISAGTIILRGMKSGGAKLTLSFYPSVALAVVYTPFGYYNYVPLSIENIGILSAVGVTLVMGQIGCVVAFTRASSSGTVAPLQYTSIIWGIVLGYLMFDNTPTTSSMIGTILIIYAGLFNIMFTKSSMRLKAQ